MNLEVSGELINFGTFSSSALFGVINKSPIQMTIGKNLIQFTVPKKAYGFSKKYTGDIYVLLVAGDTYLIESNFFENFEKLRHNLETKG